MNEVWKDVKGFEGYYMVSNKGRVKSLSREITRYNAMSKSYGKYPVKEKILKSRGDKYKFVYLSSGIKSRPYLLHRIIGIAFIPNPQNKPEINHINGDKSDNRINNLEWCTSSENTIHAVKLGLHKPPKGKDHWQNKGSKKELRLAGLL